MKISIIDCLILTFLMTTLEARAVDERNSKFRGHNIILARRGNVFKKPTTKYPINHCPQPDQPEFSDFVVSFCTFDGVTWALLCSDPASHLMDRKLNLGQCPEGYMCEDDDGDGTTENPPTAWCTKRDQSNSETGSNDDSENNSVESSDPESSDSEHRQSS